LDYIVEGQGFPLLILGDTPYYQRVFSQHLREHFQIIFARAQCSPFKGTYNTIL
jgi:hypothetical protein